MKACSIAPLTKEFLIKLLSKKNPLKKFEKKSNELKELAAMARRRRQVTFRGPLAVKKRARPRRVRPKKTMTSFFAPKNARRRPLRLSGRRNIRKRGSRRRRGRRRVAPILPPRSRRRRRKNTSRMVPAAARRRSYGRRRARGTPKRRHRPRSSGISPSAIKPGRPSASEPIPDSDYGPGKTSFKEIIKSNSSGPQSIFAT